MIVKIPSIKENVAVGRLIPAGTGTPDFVDMVVGLHKEDDLSVDKETVA